MKTEIVCLIDRSGSMESIKTDAIGGFNAFLASQKSIPGECIFTLVLFDHEISTQISRAPLITVPELDTSSFVPRGSTALYDAIGQTINQLGAQLDSTSDKPEKVIFIILTDGMENASKEFGSAKIAEMIKHQTEKYSWEFIFLAANQDAFATGSALNISAANTANFAATGVGTRAAYGTISDLTTTYRAGQQ